MDNTSTGGETTTSGTSLSVTKKQQQNRGRTETISTVGSSQLAFSTTDPEQSKDAAHAVAAAAAAENEAEGVPRWFPTCCGKPILHGNPEALGFLLGQMGNFAGILGVATFVVPALVYFAKLEAGCVVEIREGETELPPCEETVYGLKPSSMITTLVSILSLILAVMIPLIGAIIDTSPHRRQIGRGIAVLVCCLIFPQIFISESTWFPLMICALFQGLALMMLSLCLNAYLPDLTDSKEELDDFTKSFVAVPGCFAITFIITVIGVSAGLGVAGEEAPSAKIAAVIGVITVAVTFVLTWGFLFRNRPALNVLEEGESRLTAGFKKLYKTSCHLYRNDTSLLWFFVATAFGDIKPLTGIGFAFLENHQQFTNTDVGLAAVIMLVSVVPGAVVSSFMCRKVNPIRSTILSLAVFGMATVAGSIFLTGPNQKAQTYLFVALWGIVGGWKVASTMLLVASIVPEGSDAEMMGLYLFADSSLSWLSPLIYTAMNEAGISERIALSTSNVIWYVLSILAYLMMGSYDDCLRRANRISVAPLAVDSNAVEAEKEDVSSSPASEKASNRDIEKILEEGPPSEGP